jgi:hypothetical protein
VADPPLSPPAPPNVPYPGRSQLVQLIIWLSSALAVGGPAVFLDVLVNWISLHWEAVGVLFGIFALLVVASAVSLFLLPARLGLLQMRAAMVHDARVGRHFTFSFVAVITALYIGFAVVTFSKSTSAQLRAGTATWWVAVALSLCTGVVGLISRDEWMVHQDALEDQAGSN